MKQYVGIDVSKEVLGVACLNEGEVFKVRNDEPGRQQLIAQVGASCQVICEATGSYHRKLEQALRAAGRAVSVVNPRQALNYAKSQNRRNKTDRVDALLLAHFGRERRPSVSEGCAPVQQSLAREVAALGEDIGRLRNRLEAAEQGVSHPELVASLKRHIELLEQEQEALKEKLQDQLKDTQAEQLRLLQSIPGIGLHSASLLLAEVGDALRFRSARSLVAFAGLTPLVHESGKSRSYSAISRMGSAHLRRILYMPAISASRHNPSVKRFYGQLIARGKPKMVALVAAMAKLLRIVYGVLSSGKPFKVPNA
jgi:transposase